MRHLDLFSGIGGFALAASWVWGDEHEIVSFCDNDKAAQVVLKHHWPGVPIHDDIKTLNATKWRGTVDLVTGGFPCQPFSCAGKRRGAADDRYLWPEMFRVIKECRPRWVLGENVAGIIQMALRTVRSDLESIGYEVEHPVISACSVDAPHIRARVWIVAHDGRGSDEPRGADRVGIEAESGVQRETWEQRIRATSCDRRQDAADAAQELLYGGGNARPAGRGESTNSRIKSMERGTVRESSWLAEPDVGRVAHGVPFRVDRLRLLGNAIVPQVAAEIFRCMKAVDETVPTR